MINELLNFTNQYSSLITAIATMVVAVATTYYAWQNKKMVQGFKVQNRPALRFLMASDMGIKLENIGKSTAKEVNLKFVMNMHGRNETVGNYSIQELNPEETEFIDLKTKVFSILEKMELVKKEERHESGVYLDPTTGEEETYEEIVERWSIVKSKNIIFDVNSELTCKSDSGDIYSSFKQAEITIVSKDLDPLEENNFEDKVRIVVKTKTGKWI